MIFIVISVFLVRWVDDSYDSASIQNLSSPTHDKAEVALYETLLSELEMCLVQLEKFINQDRCTLPREKSLIMKKSGLWFQPGIAWQNQLLSLALDMILFQGQVEFKKLF